MKLAVVNNAYNREWTRLKTDKSRTYLHRGVKTKPPSTTLPVPHPPSSARNIAMANFETNDSIITVVSSSKDGPDLQPHLHIHGKLLIKSSRILRMLLQPVDSVVTRITPARLELDLPYKGIRILTHWLYHRELDTAVGGDSSRQLIELVNAYHVGERLEIVAFVDNCTDSILKLLDTMSEVGQAAKAMPTMIRYTRPKSRLRSLLVDWLVRGNYQSLGDSSWHALITDEAFCRMLLQGFFKRKLEHDQHLHHVARPHSITPCTWHWHAELGMPCYQKSAVKPDKHAPVSNTAGEEGSEGQIPEANAASVDPALPTFVEV